MKKTRVLLVDDHAIFRKGVHMILSEHDDLEVVGEASDGFEAIDLVEKLSPDIILMDVSMPNCTGLQALEKIIEHKSESKVVMLTVSEDNQDLFNAVKIGARGYLLKNVGPDDLYDMIMSVNKGEAPISGLMASKILEEFHKTQNLPKEDIEELTGREIDVLRLVAKGYMNTEIAEELVISESTVKTHLRVILDKLHLKNRVQVAVYAVQRGFHEEKKLR